VDALNEIDQALLEEIYKVERAEAEITIRPTINGVVGAYVDHPSLLLFGLHFRQPKDSNHYQINCNDVV